VTRAAIAEKGRTKLPMARPAGPAEQACPAPTLAQTLTQTGHPVRLLPVTDRSLDEAGWDEVMEEAMSGQIAFARGGLCISPTPAMTLIDVDGPRPRPRAGGGPGHRRRHRPTRHRRLDRHRLSHPCRKARPAGGRHRAGRGAGRSARNHRLALGTHGDERLWLRPACLAARTPQPPALFARAPLAAAARQLLRRAERVSGPGALLLTCHPALRRAVRPEWEALLARRTGRALHWQLDEALAPTAGFAQTVTARP
jgi:hypothetical protein